MHNESVTEIHANKQTFSLPAYQYLWLIWITCDTKDIRNQVSIKAENAKQFSMTLVIIGVEINCS